MKKILKWETGFVEYLTLIFIAEKLADKITWSWWWVTVPMWIPYSSRIIWYCFKVAYYWGIEAYKKKKLKEETLHAIQAGIKTPYSAKDFN